ncbi:MAG: thioredoxin family protein [Candidatus Neomarinimicrobiota bacterium]
MINKIFPIIVLLTGIVIAADGNTFTSLSFTGALNTGIEENKPVIVKFEANWCQFCKLMDVNSFSDDKIMKILEDFIAIKVDVETPEGRFLANKYRVRSLPTLIGLNTEGKLIYRRAGYQSPEKLMKSLIAINEK